MLRNDLLYPAGVSRFLKENGHRVRTEQSKDTYRAKLRHLQDTYPGKRISEFTEDDLLAWAGDPGLAPGTQLTRRNIAIAFFQWAHWCGLAEKDPSAYLKQLLCPKNHGVKHHNWLRADQLAALVAACRDGTVKGQRDLVIILVAALTGLRRDELCGLRWGAIDLPARRLRLVGKGGKPAEVGFNGQVAEALSEWQTQCAAGAGRPVQPQDPVFPRIRALSIGWGMADRELVVAWDVPLGHNGVTEVVKKRGRQAGIAALAPHDLRRSFAGLLAEQVPIADVSKALRHSNIGTTEIYLAKNPNRVVETGQRFEIAL